MDKLAAVCLLAAALATGAPLDSAPADHQLRRSSTSCNAGDHLQPLIGGDRLSAANQAERVRRQAAADSATTTTPKKKKKGGNKSKSKKLLADCLAAHNKFRRAHDAPELQWDDKLAEFAQKRSNHIAKSDGAEFGHPPDLPFGENLFWHSSTATPCEHMVRGWYDEINLYDYKAPSFAPATGHFTQLVWRGTTRVGCAFAESTGPRGGLYLTCNYDPPGNFIGEFEENVSRAKASVPSPSAGRGVSPPPPSSAAPTTSTTTTTTTTTTTPRPVTPLSTSTSPRTSGDSSAGDTPTTKPKKKGKKKSKGKKKKSDKKRRKKKGNRKATSTSTTARPANSTTTRSS